MIAHENNTLEKHNHLDEEFGRKAKNDLLIIRYYIWCNRVPFHGIDVSVFPLSNYINCAERENDKNKRGITKRGYTHYPVYARNRPSIKLTTFPQTIFSFMWAPWMWTNYLRALHCTMHKHTCATYSYRSQLIFPMYSNNNSSTITEICKCVIALSLKSQFGLSIL